MALFHSSLWINNIPLFICKSRKIKKKITKNCCNQKKSQKKNLTIFLGKALLGFLPAAGGREKKQQVPLLAHSKTPTF